MRDEYCNNCERILRVNADLQSRLAECERKMDETVDIHTIARLKEKLAAAEAEAKYWKDQDAETNRERVSEMKKNAKLLQWCERFQGLLQTVAAVRVMGFPTHEGALAECELADFEAWRKERGV